MLGKKQARIALFVTSSVLNVPFGMYRTSTERFSVPWFFAIHAPVPFVILLRRSRFLVSLSRRGALPISLLGALTGQLGGGRAGGPR